MSSWWVSFSVCFLDKYMHSISFVFCWTKIILNSMLLIFGTMSQDNKITTISRLCPLINNNHTSMLTHDQDIRVWPSSYFRNTTYNNLYTTASSPYFCLLSHKWTRIYEFKNIGFHIEDKDSLDIICRRHIQAKSKIRSGYL